MWIWIAAGLVGLAVAAGAVWHARRSAHRDVEAHWNAALQRLNDYCDRFARGRDLGYISGLDQTPHGWPRVQGEVNGAAFSLMFGWRRNDHWVAIMRLRDVVKRPAEFRVWPAHAQVAVPARGRVAPVGDPEFDEVFRVWSHGAVALDRVLSPTIREALLGIPNVELGHRDGVTVLSWPCPTYVDDSATGDDDYAALPFGFDALSAIGRGIITQEELG